MSDDQVKYLTAYAYKSRKGKKMPYGRIYADMYFSPAFLALSPTARFIYMGLLVKSGGRTKFSLSYSEFCPAVCSRQTFRTSIRQLEQHGFIKAKQNYIYESMEYSLIDDWKKEQPGEKKKRTCSNLRNHKETRPP